MQNNMFIKGKDELKEGFFGMIVATDRPVRMEMPEGCSLQLCSATFNPFDSIQVEQAWTMALLVKVDATPPIALASAVNFSAYDGRRVHIDRCQPLTHRFSDTDGSLLFTVHCDTTAGECHVAGHITRHATAATQTPVRINQDEVLGMNKLQLGDITRD